MIDTESFISISLKTKFLFSRVEILLLGDRPTEFSVEVYL